MSKCTLVDLCTIRSGSECNQKKNTPMANTAPTRTTAIIASRMSVEPGGVINGGRWLTAPGCLVALTTSGAGADDPSPFSSNVTTTDKPATNPAITHTRSEGKRHTRLLSRPLARLKSVFVEGTSCMWLAQKSVGLGPMQRHTGRLGARHSFRAVGTLWC